MYIVLYEVAGNIRTVNCIINIVSARRVGKFPLLLVRYATTTTCGATVARDIYRTSLELLYQISLIYMKLNEVITYKKIFVLKNIFL